MQASSLLLRISARRAPLMNQKRPWRPRSSVRLYLNGSPATCNKWKTCGTASLNLFRSHPRRHSQISSTAVWMPSVSPTTSTSTFTIWCWLDWAVKSPTRCWMQARGSSTWPSPCASRKASFLVRTTGLPLIHRWWDLSSRRSHRAIMRSRVRARTALKMKVLSCQKVRLPSVANSRRWPSACHKIRMLSYYYGASHRNTQLLGHSRCSPGCRALRMMVVRSR